MPPAKSPTKNDCVLLCNRTYTNLKARLERKTMAVKMDKMDGLSMNIEQTTLDKLRSVFPECVSKGKLDIESCFLCVANTSITILKSTALSGRAKPSACALPRSVPAGPCAPAQLRTSTDTT